jgi:cytochrome c-type biogenesis protein CcmE
LAGRKTGSTKPRPTTRPSRNYKRWATAAKDQKVRVGGDVEPNSITRENGKTRFVIAQVDGPKPLHLKVVYTGIDPLPDTFKDGSQALADGKLGPDGVFNATKIQAKCASKYEQKPELKRPAPAATPTGATI